jgi:hypothetical protein
LLDVVGSSHVDGVFAGFRWDVDEEISAEDFSSTFFMLKNSFLFLTLDLDDDEVGEGLFGDSSFLRLRFCIRVLKV